MQNTLDPHRTGLTLATFVGCIHLLWTVIVAAGWGQATADFFLRLHFVKPVQVIDPFQFDLAAMLVALVVAVSYCCGLLFAAIWNRLQR